MAVAKVGWLLRSMALICMSEPLDLRCKMREVDLAAASESHVQIFYAIFPSAPKVDLVGLPA